MFSEDQVIRYRQEGYTLYPGHLSQKKISQLLSDIESFCERTTLANHDQTRMEMEPNQPPDGTRVRRIYSPCTHFSLFRKLSESSKLLDCLEQLLGPNLLFHYSKINMKPPSIGSVVEWHQDLTYYPLTNRDALAVLFYLDDADTDNGCLRVIPRGHLGPALDHTHRGFFQGRIMEPVDDSKATLLEGKAGTAIFMHCMTPHSSSPNTTRRPRRTLIISYRAADTFPIYCGDVTVKAEMNVRLVRGQQKSTIRFSMTDFPFAHYRRQIASLYEIQQESRQEID